MNYIDYSVILILIASTLWGAARGFFVTVLRTFSFFIVIWISGRFHIAFAEYVFKTFPDFKTKIFEQIRSFLIETLASGDAKASDFLGYFVDASDVRLLENLKGTDLNRVIDTVPAAKNALDAATSQIAAIAVHVVSFLVLFLLLLFAVEVMILLVNGMRKLPVIGSFDRILGGVLGFVQGTLLVVLAVFLLHFLGSIGVWSGQAEALRRSFLAQRFLDFKWMMQILQTMTDIVPKEWFQGIFFGISIRLNGG